MWTFKERLELFERCPWRGRLIGSGVPEGVGSGVWSVNCRL